jgi:membrane-bound lytic murein transglycosylase B
MIRSDPARFGIAFLLCLSLAGVHPPPVSAANPFSGLSRRLVAEGFSAEGIQALYGDPESIFETEGVSLFFVHSEARLNYGQFAAPEAIQRARGYMARHRDALAAAEAAHGVPAEVITGILLVETRLGTYTGTWRVFNTLSTMAALSDPEVRKTFRQRIPPERRISPDRFAARAAAKSAWAYEELKAFLRFTAREGIDPMTVSGSYAGAMGICQFMPSNALRLALDGDGDGRVDLFSHADAIASVGNYLRHHRWRREMAREERYRVILRYNYSKPYAETILHIADQLAG